MGIIQRQTLKASFATYAGVAIGAVNLVFLFPRFLLPEQLGLTRVLIAAAVIVSQLALLGVPFALIRFFPYFRNREQKHFGFPTLMLGLSLGGFLLIGSVVFLYRDAIEELYSKNSPLFSSHFIWVFPLAFLMAMAELAFYYCRSLFKLPIPTFFREVMLRIGQSVALLLFIIGWVNFEEFLYCFVGSYLLQLLLLIGYVLYLNEFFFFSRIKKHGDISINQVLLFSLLMFGSTGAVMYTQNIDVIFLSYLIDLDNTAVYSIAFFIGTMIQIPARSMNMVATSVVAEAWKEGDMKKIQELYRQTSLNQVIVGGFIFLIIWINTDLLLSFLPPVYASAKWVIFLIGIGKLLDMASGINSEIINVSKHVKMNLMINLLLVVITTMLQVVLITKFGIMGAALATALALLIYNLIRMGFLYLKYELLPFNANSIKAALLVIGCFILAFLLPAARGLWLSGIYQSILAGGLFIVILLLFKISPEISAVFSSVLSSVKRKG